MKKSRLALVRSLSVVSAISLLSDASLAATAVTTMPITITITAGCQISAAPLNFGTAAGLFAAVNANTTLTVTCTNTTPYKIGLDAGGNTGATTTIRKMKAAGADLINYRLYQDSGLTTNFGNTVNTDTVAGTGTGSSQSIIVYGQVPTQASPAPGTYTDTVNVTLTY